MAVIGATQFEPVNVLGSYVQGMELGRANRLARMQDQELARVAEEEANLKNYLSTADLSSPEAQNQLMRMPGGAQIAQQMAQLGASRAQQSKAEIEAQRQRLTDMLNLVSSANSPESYARVRGLAGQMGIDVSAIPEQYDPAFVEQAKNAVLTAADRLEAESRSRTAKIQEGQLRLAERRFQAEQQPAVAGGGAEETVRPPTLQKGERWNPEAQRVEAVEGSDIYIKQSGKHNKDYSALNAIENQKNLANSKLQKLLAPENADAFSNLFGGYRAFVTREMSGKTAGLRSDLESLKNNLKAAGKKIIASAGPGAIGQITEREWPILEGMIAELRPTMDVEGEGGAREKLQEIKVFLDNLADQAANEYEITWGKTQFYKPKEEAKTTGKGPSSRRGSRAESAQSLDDLLNKYK